MSCTCCRGVDRMQGNMISSFHPKWKGSSTKSLARKLQGGVWECAILTNDNIIYWVGQKVCSGFSVTWQTRMNFLANTIQWIIDTISDKWQIVTYRYWKIKNFQNVSLSILLSLKLWETDKNVKILSIFYYRI